MNQDVFYLRRAIRLAMNGRGGVEPNPMVGCVIVKNDRVIGEGFHQQYGQPHAEPNALAACTESPEKATAYVTLEPCCHTHKQTPPCVPQLINAKISRVVIGCMDPNPEVNGKGAAQLLQANIHVDRAEIEAECRQMIAPFMARTCEHRPYITMKWAQTSDDKVAGPGGERLQISNPLASHQVQLLRSRSDAIVVGINTVISDDPTLLPRNVPMNRPYRRIILDRSLRLPLGSQLIRTLYLGSVVVSSDTDAKSEKAIALKNAGVNLCNSKDWLTDRNLSHVLIEPGPTLARAMFSVADRLWVIRSPRAIEAKSAPSAAEIPDYFAQTGEVDLAGDRLCEYLNTRSRVYYALVPSADFVLSRMDVSPL